VGRARRLAYYGGLGALLAFGLFDQTALPPEPSYAATRSSYENDREFVAAIAMQVPPDAMIFQLPDVSFPEGLEPNRTGSYDLLRWYLHSHGLRWSFGAMRGREPDWRLAVAEAPGPVMLSRLAALDFSGVYVDTTGYADEGKALI